MKKHIIISAILILLAYVVGFFVGDALAVKEYNMERSRLWATQSEQVNLKNGQRFRLRRRHKSKGVGVLKLAVSLGNNLAIWA